MQGSLRTFISGGGGRGGAGLRYTTDEMGRLYRQLLHAGRLRLPGGVERDDPLLFLAPGEFLDVMEQLVGPSPADAGRAFAGEGARGWPRAGSPA